MPAIDEFNDFVSTKSSVVRPISWMVPIATNRLKSASAKSINVLVIMETTKSHVNVVCCAVVISGVMAYSTADAVFTKNPLKKIENDVDASTCTLVIQ